jgi:hypothetical protein
MIREILHYQTVNSKDLFADWFDGLVIFRQGTALKRGWTG